MRKFDWELVSIGVLVLMCSGAACLCSYSSRKELETCFQICSGAKILVCKPPLVKCELPGPVAP